MAVKFDKDVLNHLTDGARAGYLASPHHCPFCGSKDIRYTGKTIDDDEFTTVIWERVECDNCRKLWDERKNCTIVDIEEV